jgi:hypothetical protein
VAAFRLFRDARCARVLRLRARRLKWRSVAEVADLARHSREDEGGDEC